MTPVSNLCFMDSIPSKIRMGKKFTGCLTKQGGLPISRNRTLAASKTKTLFPNVSAVH